MKYIVYGYTEGENYFICLEHFRMWNPLLWLIIIPQIPFILLIHGLNSITEMIREIKSMNKTVRKEVKKDVFKKFMLEHYPNKVEEFFANDLES